MCFGSSPSGHNYGTGLLTIPTKNTLQSSNKRTAKSYIKIYIYARYDQFSCCIDP
jgi:hypothetical protein